MFRSSRRSLAAILFFALLGWVATENEQRDADISSENTFNVDVCVIGGGAAGTYAAIKSKDLNKTVIIIEKQNRLGGHTKTYIDPISKKPIELGVAEYEDIPVVREFFARFKVPLYQYNYTAPGYTSESVDFQTDKIVVPKQGNLLGAWDALQKQVAKYPSLDDSLAHVPFPVPPDLLLPFGQFITKYKLHDAVPYLSLYGQGWGNFVTLPTLLAIKYFAPGFFSPASLSGKGAGALAAKDNSLIYEKATKELGPNVLLNSSVLSMDRSAADLVKITVQTPSGKKLIRARKLISAIPPILSNLHNFDLNRTEHPIFSQFQSHSWYVGLVKNSHVPSNLTLMNYGTNNTANFNIPVLPGISQIYATAVPFLHYFLFEGNDSQPTVPESQVISSLKDTLSRLQAAGTIPKPPKGADPIEVVEFSSHTPYEVFAPSEQIAKGFYNKLFALQGQRNTYWTGAAFVTHSSALIWNYTDALVTKMWKD